MKSCLSSSPAEWGWTLQRLQGVLAAPGTKQLSKHRFSLPKREIPTSTITGTRSGVWYPVALPWDQMFCVLFSHIYRETCTLIAFKKIQKKKTNYFEFTLSRQQQSETSPGFGVGAARSSPSILCTTTSKTQLDQLQSQLMKPSLEFVSQITARN